MTNLALAIALAARAKQFPVEYDKVLQLRDKSRRDSDCMYVLTASIDWKPYGWAWWSQHLAGTFGLYMLGKLRTPKYGYLRLPTSIRGERKLGLPEQLYMARFAPDIRVIRGWGI